MRAVAVLVAFASVASPRLALAEPTASKAQPDVLPADPYELPPPGYHREEQPAHQGVFIAGAITGGVGVTSIGIAIYKDISGDHFAFSSGVFYLAGGVCLAVGVPLFSIGLRLKRSVDVRDTPPTVSLQPTFGAEGTGARLVLVM